MTEPQATAKPPTDKRRRELLYAGVAGAAALAGAGAALWKWSPDKVTTEEVNAIWAMSFDSPAGQPVPMQAFRGRPLVLNFWATWCPPCVAEMPLLDAFFRENTAKPWQVIGLAIDQPSAVRAFLQKTPVTYPIGMAGLGGTEMAKSLGNTAGGLPFTVVLGPSGEVLERRMGRIEQSDLAQWSKRA